MRIYTVGYAYPTSEYAVKCGRGKTGCYVVEEERSVDGVHRRLVSGHATRAEAEDIARGYQERAKLDAERARHIAERQSLREYEALAGLNEYRVRHGHAPLERLPLGTVPKAVQA